MHYIKKLRKYTFFFLLLISIIYKANAQQDTLNPLKGDIRVHDPVMIKEGNTYHVYQTRFGIGAKTSKDRITWYRDSCIFARGDMPSWFTKDIPEQKGALWAPDIHYRDGKYGFFTENDTTFIVYHAYTRAAAGASLLNIKPLYMDTEGWPTPYASKKLFRREVYDGK